MKTIDTSKPLQLADGQKVTLISAYVDAFGSSCVEVQTAEGDFRCFYKDTGHHVYGSLPDLQNVPGYNVEIGTELFFGKPEGSLRAEVKFLSDTACAARSNTGYLYEIQLDTMKDQFGDKWNIVVPEVTEWINVYADGSCGSTRHKSRETAFYDTKNGKTRVGILKRVLRNDEVVSAEVEPTVPRFRDRGSLAHNPFTGEAA